MELKDVILLLHPAIAVIVVFPLIGIVLNRALQVRQRRLQTATDGKSKIPPVVGQEHVKLGRILTGAVVGIILLALGFDIFNNILEKQVLTKAPFQVLLLVLFFVAAIASLALLYQAGDKKWRAIFATLTGIALVVLGCQDGIYRKTSQWYFSHYYYGITAALLMIFSVAILPDIYKDKTNRWRKVHIALNSIALLLFIGQGITGTMALLEVPLSWQESYVNKLYEQQCQMKPCTIIQAPNLPKKP
jgi:peptidoglycan/LPS O-acetylase OafA/YrhL